MIGDRPVSPDPLSFLENLSGLEASRCLTWARIKYPSLSHKLLVEHEWPLKTFHRQGKISSTSGSHRLGLR